MSTQNFTERHNGPRTEEINQMLKVVGVSSMDELIDKTVPTAIRLKAPLNLPKGMSEYDYLNHIKGIACKNKVYKTFIGMGYYNTITPSVILRNVFENPGWYTSYTPYQAEISQGRLEALFNYQSMVSDLIAMPIVNASLLDEATAASEAMLMFYYSRSREAVKNDVKKFFIAEDVFPQTIDVVRTVAEAKNIELVIGNPDTIQLDNTFFGSVIQYPNQYGNVKSPVSFIEKAKKHQIYVAIAGDLLSLALLTPPGELGVDCAFGSTQRFGIPMGFGGPSAAYFGCTEEFKRQIPGRIIGLTIDAQGNQALRMALQTREQHIKREKATSNICTAQVLLAIMAGFYACWHGPKGIREIAKKINTLSGTLSKQTEQYGYKQLNAHFFDTLHIQIPASVSMQELQKTALENKLNFRYIDDKHIGISLDETTSICDINTIIRVLATAAKQTAKEINCQNTSCTCEVPAEKYPAELQRKSSYMTHPIFNSHHSETEMMRYMKKLELKDLALNRAMIPLGSCTLKLNAASEMLPLSWSEFGSIHPFVPNDQAAGYLELIENMTKDLSEITGFASISFQPNSGASGEYAGLMVIRAYHNKNGQHQRNICLIPASAHGTNPASAAKANMEIVTIKSTEQGEIDINDLREKAEQYKDTLSCIMITYPSTHGVFEEGILEIIDIIHKNGGQVYMDGANMNAQVGLTSPGFMGADVCHLNLHKTFAIPHGGGGPGVGPIGVAKHLVEFLPKHSQVKTGGENGMAVSASPFGSAMVLPITYGYIKMLGCDGLTAATRMAILTANYMKARLANTYKILYTGAKGMCAHEFIIDCNSFSISSGIQVGDMAKRLMDYGFHAPTVAFPVHGTLMIEPTESEPLSEIDRLCNALISIREEIAEIEKGAADKQNNVIKNAPHSMAVICSDEWDKPYSRKKAAFAQKHDDKYWPACGKVDDAFGDRNLKAHWDK